MSRKKRITFLIVGFVTILCFLIGFLAIDAMPKATFYTVVFNSNGGTPVDSIKVKSGDKITKPYTEKLGYGTENWYCDTDEKVWNFSVDIVTKDITLSAVWAPSLYTITYNTDGGVMPEPYQTTYTIESDFDLVRAIKDDQLFIGWFDTKGNRIDSIKPGMYGNISLTARWTGDFKAISEDESKGTINVYVSETNPNEYKLTNNPANYKHHLFKGWYDKNGNLLSTNPEYTLTINPDITTYIYSRYMTDIEESEWNLAHGVTPTQSVNKVIYGMYPQANVNEPAILDKLEQLSPTRFNGYYYYNHEYYVKKIARLARDLNTHELLSVRKFDNGDEFIEDETYWFKVEPVSWNILKKSSNQYSLVSEKLLDVRRYHRNSSIRIIDEKTIYSNNYKYSDIREWLNNDFISASFAFNKSNLSIMEVDNSKESTATPDSGFECENTFDYVTLLSYREYDEESILDRQIKTTDYARVSGANYSVNENNLFSGYYWTRSPIESEEEDKNGTAASRCNMNGTLNSDYIGWGGSCVQPSISLTMNNFYDN